MFCHVCEDLWTPVGVHWECLVASYSGNDNDFKEVGFSCLAGM